MTETLDKEQTLCVALKKVLGHDCLHLEAVRDEVMALVVRTRIVEVCRKLRDDPELHFTQLMDICGADYPRRGPNASTSSISF